MRKWIWYVLAALFTLGIGLVIWQLDLPNWQKLDLDRIRNLPETTIVYDVHGNSAGSLYASENRQYVSLADIPDHVAECFIAAEDSRFYQHNGVDIRRVFGALWHDLKTLSLDQGASTITQQLIKLTHLTSEKTLSRKAQEAFLAMQLEKQLSKDEILEAYLNVVYFGNGAYGIETAAQAYFSKSASELTLDEGALLAGIIKSPSNYAPHLNPENAIERRNLVLDRMLENGYITQDEHDAAVAAELRLELNDNMRAQSSWYLDAVLDEASDVLEISVEEVLSSGLRIYTAYNPSYQQAADALFENGANFPDPAADGTAAQAALVAMNTQNGEIQAMVGGRSYDVQRGLNRATQIQRSPGSAIKPVSTYAAAIDLLDMLPTSTANDTARIFGDGYAPGNAGGKTYGVVTLRETLSRSLNLATVDLAERVGMMRVRSTLERFGVDLAAQDVNLSLSLGSMTYGISPAELCAAYCALANGGIRVEPHTIRRITSASGKLLYEAETPDTRVIRETSAFLLTDMLKTAATSGSAKALASAGMPVAAKTGTVSEAAGGTRDIWTAAYTPEVAVTVWMGFDQPDAEHALPDSAGGSGQPARLCAAFLKSISPLLSGRDFSVPEGLTAVEIDLAALDEYQTVMLAAANTPQAYRQTEYFYSNAVPNIVSDLWEAPEMVDDLKMLTKSGETPAIAFTSKNSAVDYLILRKTGDETEIVAEVSADAGNVIIWADPDADLDQVYSYSVLPRHRLLYESGTTLTGKESASVSYTPGGFLNRIFGIG